MEMERVNEYMPLFQRLARGTATEEDRALYMDKYATAMERKLNKTYFEFNAKEALDFLIEEENSREGDLHITDGTRYN